MSTQPKDQHIHTYERSKANKNVYRCTDPGCPHYHTRPFLIGKECICYKCGAVFLLSEKQLYKMNVKRPVCEMCSKSPKAQQFKDAAPHAFEILRKLENAGSEESIEDKEKKEGENGQE